MLLSRRYALSLGGAAITVSLIPFDLALAANPNTNSAIEEFTGGADITDGGVVITAPEVADNGGAVPVTVKADDAVSIVLLADGNPSPKVITFNFGELAGYSEAFARIRMAQTQNLIAIAKMADGTFKSGAVKVKVTIGGCG